MFLLIHVEAILVVDAGVLVVVDAVIVVGAVHVVEALIVAAVLVIVVTTVGVPFLWSSTYFFQRSLYSQPLFQKSLTIGLIPFKEY